MMNVYENGCDSVVAESPDDAFQVWCETTGEDRADYPDMEWALCPDNVSLTIRYEEHTYADLYDERPKGATVEEKGGVEYVTATHAAWAKLNGRGWLCSEEW